MGQGPGGGSSAPHLAFPSARWVRSRKGAQFSAPCPTPLLPPASPVGVEGIRSSLCFGVPPISQGPEGETPSRGGLAPRTPASGRKSLGSALWLPSWWAGRWGSGTRSQGLTLRRIQAKSQGQEDHKQACHPRPQTGHCHRPRPGSPPDGSGEQKGLTGPKGHRDAGFRGEGKARDPATRNPTHRRQETDTETDSDR